MIKVVVFARVSQMKDSFVIDDSYLQQLFMMVPYLKKDLRIPRYFVVKTRAERNGEEKGQLWCPCEVVGNLRWS